ncbi:MAG: hypothetical protein HW407_2156, partial [Bacteroidetes bacterium]|nr:hypothetical protein [Bacteroidota bacterium]
CSESAHGCPSPIYILHEMNNLEQRDGDGDLQRAYRVVLPCKYEFPGLHKIPGP